MNYAGLDSPSQSRHWGTKLFAQEDSSNFEPNHPIKSRKSTHVSAWSEGVSANAPSGASLRRRLWRVGALKAQLLSVALLQFGAVHARASLDPSKSISQYVHSVWQSDAGLPANSVLSLAQTSDGYLWLGSEEGLVRFDGVRFTVYSTRTTPGLHNDQISALLVDRQQNLWIGTRGGGLSCFRHGRFVAFPFQARLSSSLILSLYEDSRGALWVGTDGDGLLRFENGQVHVFTKADGLADNSVFALSADGQGTLWIGTHNGLSRLTANKFVTFTTKNGLGSNYIRALHVDRNGIVWIGTNGGGLCRLSSDGMARYTQKDGLTDDIITALKEDSAGTLWIGTSNGGLNRFSHGRFSDFTAKNGFSGSGVWAIFEGREGNLWIGSTDGGLNSLRDGNFTTISKQEGLTSEVVLPVYEDRQGALWIGSDQGLHRWIDGQITLFTTKNGLPDNLIFSVTQDGRGTIWAGTRHGLARFNGHNFETLNSTGGLPSDFVICTYTDREGRLWVGTRDGLSRFDGTRFVTYTTRDGLSNDFVQSIYEDAQGTLWIGTSGGGLNSFSDGRFSSYTTRNGLSDNRVLAINGDADGTLWITTNGGGLNRLKDGKITRYTAESGLFDNIVFEVLDDGLGHLWMTSNKGIFSVSKKQLSAFADGLITSIKSEAYGTEDGMKSRECNGGFQPAGWKTRDGRLCFPTSKGVSIVNPARLMKHHPPQTTILERALADDKILALDTPNTVPPGKGQLEFDFTAPSFAAPEKIHFRYMLKGFDKDWVQAETRRVAYYTNIPPGDYSFLVAACDGDNECGENAPAVSLTLEPHFYQTTRFFLLICALMGGVAFGLHRVRTANLRAREKELLRIVDERTQELRQSRDELEIRVEERTRDLLRLNQSLEAEISVRRLAEERAEAASRAKSDFLSNMSHEIRTPINGIMGMADIALSSELNEEQTEYVQIIKTSADSLLAIVNDILDFSKIEARKLTLEQIPFRLSTSLGELSKLLSFRAQQKQLSLTMQSADDVPNDLIGDPGRLRQVLLNLLDNAMKFTSEGGVALFAIAEDVSDDAATLHFSVIDTGVGISKDKQRIIFEAFSQADASSTRQYGGTGLGLTICSQLVGLMGGRIWVESALGAGSTFHFTATFGRKRETSVEPVRDLEYVAG